MAHTYKTDPWHVKEARGAAWHPTQFAREHSPYTKARRELSKRIRARLVVGTSLARVYDYQLIHG